MLLKNIVLLTRLFLQFIIANPGPRCEIKRQFSNVLLSLSSGVGTGKAINGGFGLVLDGSERVDSIIRLGLDWDVMGGVARRAWARNEHSVETAADWNKMMGSKGQITLPFIPPNGLVEDLVKKKLR